MENWNLMFHQLNYYMEIDNVSIKDISVIVQVGKRKKVTENNTENQLDKWHLITK